MELSRIKYLREEADLEQSDLEYILDNDVEL